MLEADADADAAGWLEKQVLPGLRGSQLIHIIVVNFVVVVAVVCLYLIAKNYNSVKFIMKIIIMHVLFVVVVVLRCHCTAEVYLSAHILRFSFCVGTMVVAWLI